MKLQSQITVHRQQKDATIQLLKVDLTAIPPEHAADILVVSVFPDDAQGDLEKLLAAIPKLVA